MATLECLDSGATIVLRGHDTVGAVLPADLLITAPTVSRIHGAFSWRGGLWVFEDKSRNGTLLDGRRMPGRLPVRLQPGQTLVFGCERVPGAAWKILDLEAPTFEAECLDTGSIVRGIGGHLEFYSDGVEAYVNQAPGGRWFLHRSDADEQPVAHGDVIDLGGARWRLSLPILVPEITVELAPSIDDVCLVLEGDPETGAWRGHLVHRDGSTVAHFQPRACLHLAAVLARELRLQRLEDRRRGWADDAELLTWMGWKEERLASEVFKLRRLFSSFHDGRSVVERENGFTRLVVRTELVER